MNKYVVQYKGKTVNCDDLKEAFHTFGFKLVKTKYEGRSDSTHYVTIAPLKHCYCVGGKGDFTIEEIMVDVVKTVCKIYRNAKHF